MRVATNKSLAERQQYVVDLLAFIRDFNGLDTTLVMRRVQSDEEVLEAAEAVLLSAVGAWKSMEALRDFAVQTMFGDKPPGSIDTRPSRVSPFSVPWPLLKALAPNASNFNPRQLRSLNLSEMFEIQGELVGGDWQWFKQVHQGEAWLVATMRIHVLPPHPKNSKITVTDLGSSRILHEGPVTALVVDTMPCFWFLPPNSALQVQISRQRPDPDTDALMVIEGWRYTF